LHRTPLPAFATTHDSARVLEAPGSGKNFPRHDSGDVPHRADGGCSPRSGVVRPELSLALTVTETVAALCGRMIFGGECETSVSLHRKP
jgi:hypothetical protein